MLVRVFVFEVGVFGIGRVVIALLCLEQGKLQGQNQVEDKIFKDDELVSLVDPILNTDDSNRDGYIDYPEFVRAQKKAAAQKP